MAVAFRFTPLTAARADCAAEEPEPQLPYADGLEIFWRIGSIDDYHSLQRQFEAFYRLKPCVGERYEVLNEQSNVGTIFILDPYLTSKQLNSFAVDMASRTSGRSNRF